MTEPETYKVEGIELTPEDRRIANEMFKEMTRVAVEYGFQSPHDPRLLRIFAVNAGLIMSTLEPEARSRFRQQMEMGGDVGYQERTGQDIGPSKVY